MSYEEQVIITRIVAGFIVGFLFGTAGYFAAKRNNQPVPVNWALFCGGAGFFGWLFGLIALLITSFNKKKPKVDNAE